MSSALKSHHRQSPAVNETGPDVGPRGGRQNTTGGSLSHSLPPCLLTADELPKYSSSFQDAFQVHLEYVDVVEYRKLKHTHTDTPSLTFVPLPFADIGSRADAQNAADGVR